MHNKRLVERNGSREPDGIALKRLREELLQLSQVRFARELGISFALVQKLEAGETSLSGSVRQSVHDTYAAELRSGAVVDLSGNPYRRELVGLLRDHGRSKVVEQSLLGGIKKDLELLLLAAAADGVTHALVSRIHRAIARIADDLQLTVKMEQMQKEIATVSAGEIRAWERTAPWRRKHDLLCRRIERLEVAGVKGRQQEQKLNTLRQEAAKLALEIEERKKRINVRGRRKLIHHWIGGQPVKIPPSVSNSHRYPVSQPSREFCHWWDDYFKGVCDLSNPPPDPGEY